MPSVKLSLERLKRARLSDPRLSMHYSAEDLSEALLQTRALLSFETAAVRYPIHRSLRYAVRRPLEDVFDDLALDSGLIAHRLSTGSLLLDGPGALIRATGKRKTDYCSCEFQIWAESKARAAELDAAFTRVLGDKRIQEPMFTLDWHFAGAHGGLANASFEEIAQDVLHDEAYPMLPESVKAFIQRYLAASETVLIVQGPPGTGKTRLVRGILEGISQRKGENARVMYTADKRALESDEIFVEFITDSHDAFVVEDADHLLQARSKGNIDLHRFLAIADGVVRAQGRKIIFTTNLPNVGDIDEALLRPGRCFANLSTRLLRPHEAQLLIARLCPGATQTQQRALELALPAGAKGASVAVIYRACAEVNSSPSPH